MSGKLWARAPIGSNEQELINRKKDRKRIDLKEREKLRIVTIVCKRKWMDQFCGTKAGAYLDGGGAEGD